MVKMHKDIRSIAELVEVFAVSVLNYSEFILKDSRKANRHYDDFIKAMKRIAAHGEEGLTALANLLDDERMVVRVTAACYLVHFRAHKAMSVLREAAMLENRAIAMLALATIKRWENGVYLDPATGKETKLPG
jgi:hypothetical protein